MEEIRNVLRKMKKGKAQGPDGIPVEVCLALGTKGVQFLANVPNRLLRGEKMPNLWRIVLMPLSKGKENIMECGNHREIKLISTTIKLWERVIDSRIRKEVTTAEQQFEFMPGRSTTNEIFCLRMLMENRVKARR